MSKHGYWKIAEQITSFLVLLFFFTGCQNHSATAQKEAWVDLPVSDWPDFALTNTIRFTDTTFTELANAFLIDTGYDTLAVTCKHIFLVFKNIGLKHIDPGASLVEWYAYPKDQVNKKVVFGDMINRDINEETREFNTLKDRDWIIFHLRSGSNGVYPLKIRTEPLKKGENVYSVGWSAIQKTEEPLLVRMQVYENMGNYCYISTSGEDIDPHGSSGSPVIDSNGHLVGLVSGAEGNLGVIAAVPYLVSLFEKYGIEYTRQ
jgi:hypothetical protein